MREHLKRNLLLGLAAAAVLAGVIILVSGGGGHPRHNGRTSAAGRTASGDQRLAAEYLRLSSNDLRQRLRAGESLAEIAGVTPGKSAAGLIAVLLARREAALAQAGGSQVPGSEAIARARAAVKAEVNRTRGLNASLQTAAAYIGVSQATLRTGLRAGSSLAELAAAHGRSRAGLIDALTALKAKRLRTALAKGEITSAEEKAALRTLHPRVLKTAEEHSAAPSG